MLNQLFEDGDVSRPFDPSEGMKIGDYSYEQSGNEDRTSSFSPQLLSTTKQFDPMSDSQSFYMMRMS